MAQRPHGDADDLIDQASMDSFPASDPPGYTSISIGGPPVDANTGRSPRDWPRATAAAQACYFLATGLAPFLSRRAFERLTGHKQDWWLVQTVGVMVTAVGGTLALAALRRRVTPEVQGLAAGSAAGLMALETGHALRGRISRVYLLDAALELTFLVSWLATPWSRWRGRRSGTA